MSQTPRTCGHEGFIEDGRCDKGHGSVLGDVVKRMERNRIIEMLQLHRRDAEAMVSSIPPPSNMRLNFLEGQIAAYDELIETLSHGWVMTMATRKVHDVS